MPLIKLSSLEQFAAINLNADPGVVGGPVVIPNAVKLMIVWNLADGKVARNVLGAQVAPAFTPTVAIAEAARAALVNGSTWSTLAGFLAPTASLAAVELQDIRTASQTIVRSTGAATPGTSAGTQLPSEVAVVITLRTALTGPGNRGRVYIPGWATNATAAGDVVAAGAVAALQSWSGTNIALAMNALPGTWSLLQPARAQYTGITGTVHPARPAGLRNLTSASVRDNHWDSQRRRGLK